jgi:hypothetical protein
MSRPNPPHSLRLLPTVAALLALAAFSTVTTQAHAGPTVSADLDLGTSVLPSGTYIAATQPVGDPLYLVGFTLRAGWRFDLGPVWLLPEIGGGYAVERFQFPEGMVLDLGRFFGGARVGWSGVLLAPELRFEPSIFGHVGGGWYSDQMTGVSFDAGISLDLRIRQHFIVGAQAGYDVVRVPPMGSQGQCSMVAFGMPCDTIRGTPALLDEWVTYGIHAGWLFW